MKEQLAWSEKREKRREATVCMCTCVVYTHKKRMKNELSTTLPHVSGRARVTPLILTPPHPTASPSSLLPPCLRAAR